MRQRILIIDNDSLMRQVLAICLNDAGWEVLQYNPAHIDSAALKQLHPDLIILDFTKREGGVGWEFLQMLKMDDTTAQIPILITTTAFSFSAEIKAYLLAQYIQVIYRPFDLDTVVRLVRRTLAMADQADVIISGNRTLPILLVEDTEDLRDSITTILMLEGYQVVTAENGLLALDAVYHAEHSLIFLDIAMPVMDGVEFLRIYNRQMRPHAPVIVLSAEIVLPRHTLPAFVVEVIPKPFEVSHLLRSAEKYAQPV